MNSSNALDNDKARRRKAMTTEQLASLKRTARMTGILMLVMAVLAGFGIMYVPTTLTVVGDATATANNILASEGLLRAGMVAEVLVVLIEIVLVVLLYVLLKPVDKTLSLLAAFARLAMTVVQAVNVFNLVFALLLLSGASFLTAFEPAQLHALVLVFMEAHEAGALIWGLFFGLHLVFSGYLVFKSGYLPKYLGVLLLVVSCAYFVQSFGTFLLPQLAEALATVGLLSIVEIVFPLWLVIRGVRDRS
jgi:hypothetical protein